MKILGNLKKKTSFETHQFVHLAVVLGCVFTTVPPDMGLLVSLVVSYFLTLWVLHKKQENEDLV